MFVGGLGAETGRFTDWAHSGTGQSLCELNLFVGGPEQLDLNAFLYLIPLVPSRALMMSCECCILQPTYPWLMLLSRCIYVHASACPFPGISRVPCSFPHRPPLEVGKDHKASAGQSPWTECYVRVLVFVGLFSHVCTTLGCGTSDTSAPMAREKAE